MGVEVVMYKLLIVDDEEFVRSSIATAIDWNALGFSEVRQAENGLQALEIALDFKPDLMLADIKMPFMNGLELTEKLKEKKSETMVAIMTGYDDFKFAQKGIDLGIISYILKPVGIASLTEKIQEIKLELDIKNRERKYLEKVRKQLLQSLPLLKERFLNILVCSPEQKGDVSDKMEFMELSLEPGLYTVCIIEPDLSNCNNNDVELYNFAIKNIVTETIGGENPVFCDNSGRTVAVFFNPETEDEKEMRGYIAETLNIIQTNINQIFNLQITSSIGITVSNYHELNASYTEAQTALECRYILGKNKVYDIYDLDYHKTNFRYPFEDCSLLIDAVKIADVNRIAEYISLISEFLKNQKSTSAINIKMVYTEIVTNLLKLLTKVKETNIETWSGGFSLFDSIQKVGTIEEISDAVLSFALKVSNELNTLMVTSNKNLVDRVIDFVGKNYAEDDLSLTSVAAFSAVSSGYLSVLFKKETGQNFIDFLTQVRMEKAKIMLRTTDLKSYEVADQTGFNNSHYFSYAFKKYTGVSPSEFKNLPRN
jgi:two-component system response regulator YesN